MFIIEEVTQNPDETAENDAGNAPLPAAAAAAPVDNSAVSVPAGDLAHLRGLADRARDYVEAASSANTRLAYASDWKHFSGWCRRQGLAVQPPDPQIVGLYITAGYWFTSSTSFANPAVMVGRSFTTTFASINPKSFHVFFGGQVVGLVIALPFNAWLFQRYSAVDAFKVLLRQKAAQSI